MSLFVIRKGIQLCKGLKTVQEERLLVQGKNWRGFEERDAFGLSAGQPVSQKQPDQTKSRAKPNTSRLQSDTEKQSCSPRRDHTAHSQCLDQAHSAKRFATTFLACDPDKQSKVYLGFLITGCITCSNGDQLIWRMMCLYYFVGVAWRIFKTTFYPYNAAEMCVESCTSMLSNSEQKHFQLLFVFHNLQPSCRQRLQQAAIKNQRRTQRRNKRSEWEPGCCSRV